jgi:hypothetical protein
MECRTLQVGNSIYLHIPDSVVKEMKVENKKAYYPTEEQLKALFH